jgi:acyl carrier protein
MVISVNGLHKKLFNLEKKGEQNMLEQVKEIVADALGVEADSLTAETSFKEDLNADSLDLFEMVMTFEEEFGKEIPTEDLEKITTIGAVVEYLEA